MPKAKDKAESPPVTLHVSEGLRNCGGLCERIEEVLEKQTASSCLPISDALLLQQSESVVAEGVACETRFEIPWLYMETDFEYAPHRLRKLHPADFTGTQHPVVLLFAGFSPGPAGGSLQDCCSRLPDFLEWLLRRQPSFGDSRFLLIFRHAAGRRNAAQTAELAASCLVGVSVGLVEVADDAGAAKYVAQCVNSVVESQRRRIPSRFKVAGPRCQTLSIDSADAVQMAWISQLMQIPGISEEVAKAIATRHKSPALLMEALVEWEQECASGVLLRGDGSGHPRHQKQAQETFLAAIEVPARGKREVRRIGAAISKRVCGIFHASAAPYQLLS
mmetsp:Transcript_21567/g.50286  ORF Transcript_21567/g.50286 Transcript_21567/m.50286 type:complete len:333 (-) Transcript_21567:74-1072(-)